MDRKYGAGKSSSKCEKCGSTLRAESPKPKTKRTSERGQQIKKLMAERKHAGHPITLGEASKIVASVGKPHLASRTK